MPNSIDEDFYSNSFHLVNHLFQFGFHSYCSVRAVTPVYDHVTSGINGITNLHIQDIQYIYLLGYSDQ